MIFFCIFKHSHQLVKLCFSHKFSLVIPAYCCRPRLRCVGFFLFIIIPPKASILGMGLLFLVLPRCMLKLAKPFASRSRWEPQIIRRKMQEKYVSTRSHSSHIALSMWAHVHTHITYKYHPHTLPPASVLNLLSLWVQGWGPGHLIIRSSPGGTLKERRSTGPIAMIPGPLQPFR